MVASTSDAPRGRLGDDARDDAWPGREVAIVGDVHGCAAALASLLDGLERAAPRARVLLVGDLLTKGDDPATVVEVMERRIREGRPLESVAGNHDWRLLQSIRTLRCSVRGGAFIDGVIDGLPRGDRRCIALLAARGALAAAERILASAVRRAAIRGPHCEWTVVHAGIDPTLGFDGTSDEAKRTLKAREGERPWWDRYDGRDGLVVCGHRPLDDPLRRCVAGRPVAVNCDTGCVVGGGLTAYLLGEDCFVSVPSGGGRLSSRRPTRDSSGPRAASAVLARSSAPCT